MVLNCCRFIDKNFQKFFITWFFLRGSFQYCGGMLDPNCASLAEACSAEFEVVGIECFYLMFMFGLKKLLCAIWSTVNGLFKDYCKFDLKCLPVALCQALSAISFKQSLAVTQNRFVHTLTLIQVKQKSVHYF